MTQVSERRDPGARRVSVSTLVEVVGNVPGIPVFEAEALDVSARGMHLRTAYLPQEGDPLVCRFENEGREILVEGVVAWRREHSRGGEFGVQFTALDSKSVESLRELCGSPNEAQGPGAEAGPVGTRVRLHIDGLGSPMKARVKEGGSARLQVGSSLEFLKLGRKLELEDIERGARREAQIDGVSVVVDPSTQIPQLVVALRFEGTAEDTTPSPHHHDVAPSRAPVSRLDLPASQVTTDGVPRAEAKSELSNQSREEASVEDDDPEMRGKVAQFAERAGEHAKDAGIALASVSSSAAKGAVGLFHAAVAKFRPAAQRRTTSPKRVMPPSKPRLRSQHGGVSEALPVLSKLPVSKKTAIAIGAVTLVLGTTAAFSLGGGSEAPARTAAPTDQPVSADVVAAAPEKPSADGAVTANVPLFGPTPLATTEPAPLGPGPGANPVEAAEKADAAALSPSRAADLEWAEEDGTAPQKKRDRDQKKSDSDKASSRPEDVNPWGRGKMKEPTIHRLRLDAPGAALSGAAEATGFSVVVPSRKVMEATAGIAKRDPRIARILASNTPAGAQVSIRFKGPVPAYRVRLRKDYVEFLISAPGSEAVAKGATKSTGATKSR